MTHEQKAITTVWSSLLALPILWFAFGYASMECGELDPCPTGGSMPYALVAWIAFVAIAGLHAAFLFMVWRREEGGEE